MVYGLLEQRTSKTGLPNKCISPHGDVIEPDEDVAAIGSGGPFALSAATALMRHTKLSAKQISEESLKLASKTCIYTNDNITWEELG